MTIELDIEGLKEAIGPVLEPLEDYNGTDLPYINNLTHTIPFSIGDAKGSIVGAADVELFNAKDDKDTDGILGDKSQKPADTDLVAAIQYSKDSCWLKYSADAQLKGNAAQTLADLDIGIDVDAGLSLLAYRCHEPDDKLGSAVISDVVTTPLIFNIDDVRALKENEAVVMDTNGTIKANASFKWSDIVAQNIGVFSRWLDQGELLNIKIDASLSASINVALSGGFKVVFSRSNDDPDHIQLAIKKSSSFSLNSSISAQLVAGWQDEDAFKKAYGALLTGIFDEALDKVKAIEDATSLDDLDDNLKKVTEKLIERLGLDAINDELSDLKAKIEAIKKDVLQKIEEVAEAKAKLSFAFEYSRTSSNQSLVEAKLTDQGLNTVHQRALFGDISKVTQSADDSDITISRFFYQTTTNIKYSWGFNLGFGSWSAMSRDSYSFKTIENQNKFGNVQLSTIGMRGYKDKWGDDKRNYYISFDAEMERYSPDAEPSLDEFTLGLTLVHEQEEAHLDKREVEYVLDDLAVWGQIPARELEEAEAQLQEIFDGASDIKIVKMLNIEHDAFIALLPLMAHFDQEKLAESLAAALPINRKILPDRTLLANRIDMYDLLFQAWLEERLDSPDEMANAAFKLLKSMGYKNLARKERDWRKAGVKSQTIAGVLQTHPDLLSDVKNLCKGFDSLNLAYQQGGSYKVLRSAFNLFDDMGEHAFYNRFFANYVMLCATELADLSEGVSVSVKFEFTKDGEQQDVVWKKQ